MVSFYCESCENYKNGMSDRCNGCTPSLIFGGAPSKYKKYKEDKNLIITIIGSMSRAKEMDDIKAYFERFGHKVNIPNDEKLQNNCLFAIQKEWIDKIEEADLIIVIPKYAHLSDKGTTKISLEFGESTSYEMAIATKFKKKIVIG